MEIPHACEGRAVLTADRQGHVVSASVKLLSLLGFSSEEQPAQVVLQALPTLRLGTDDSQRPLATWAAVQRGASELGFVHGVHRDGSLVPLRIAMAQLNLASQPGLSVLLLETLRPSGAALLFVDPMGFIRSATENITSIFYVNTARDMCGLALEWLLVEPRANPIADSLAGAANPSAWWCGVPVEVLVRGGATGRPMECLCQVLEVRSFYAVALWQKSSSHEDLGSLDDVKATSSAYDVHVDALPAGTLTKGVHQLTATAVDIKTVPFPSQEALVLRTVHHPNIVQLYDVMCTGPQQTMHLVLESSSGCGSLADKFTHVSEDVVRPLYRDLMSALGYLHRKGIAHCNVTLETCLLDQRGCLKLTGFEHSTREMLYGPCGCAPDYLAPEALRNRQYRGFPADMWASGVLLYVLLTGLFPFGAVATLKGLYHPDLDLTPCVKVLLRELFQTDSQLRITADQALRHEWVTGQPQPPCSEPDACPTIRADILAFMETRFRLPPDAVVEALLAQDFNQLSATYNMLEATHPDALAEVEGFSLNKLTRRSSV